MEYPSRSNTEYHLNRPNGFGTLLASQINGRQLDWRYRKEERRVRGDYRKAGEDFRIELTRIVCLVPFITSVCTSLFHRKADMLRVFLLASIAQGWTLQAKAPLAATLVLGFLVGLGTGTLNTGTRLDT